MLTCFFIFAAGGIGSLCRYFVSFLVGSFARTSFPLGTLSVNMIGSFIMGICFAFFEYYIISSEIKLTITVGFLGGFTTFSTFALETTNLLRDKEYRIFLYNILISNIFGLFCVILGMGFTKLVTQ